MLILRQIFVWKCEKVGTNELHNWSIEGISQGAAAKPQMLRKWLWYHWLLLVDPLRDKGHRSSSQPLDWELSWGPTFIYQGKAGRPWATEMTSVLFLWHNTEMLTPTCPKDSWWGATDKDGCEIWNLKDGLSYHTKMVRRNFPYLPWGHGGKAHDRTSRNKTSLPPWHMHLSYLARGHDFELNLNFGLIRN